MGGLTPGWRFGDGESSRSAGIFPTGWLESWAVWFTTVNARFPVNAEARRVHAHGQTQSSHHYCQHDRRCRALEAKSSVQLTVILETHSKPFGVVRKLGVLVLESRS
jgi:hypothetical protein